MATIDLTMTLVAILIIPVSIICIMIVVHFSQRYFRSQQEYLGHVNGHIEEMYSGHIIVKAFNRENKSIEEFNEYNETLYNSAWKSQFLSGMMQPIMNFISNLGYVVICIIGGYRATRGQVTVGDIQAFIPVSYTHLDVYKRQVSTPCSNNTSAKTSEPVNFISHHPFLNFY